MIGTGITRTKQQQMDALSYNAVKRVEEWLLENPEWFVLPMVVPAKVIDAGAESDR